MKPNKPIPKSRQLDQFYTDSSYAQHFLNHVSTVVDLSHYDHILEPSAGAGNFYNLMDPAKRIGLDLEPKAPGIVQIDFFDWTPPKDKRIIAVGNPPFGKNAALAVKFFNRAAEFCDVIAFVIPRTFRKASVINRLNPQFHVIYDETVPDYSFVYEGTRYNVPCAAQIWQRQEQPRGKIVTLRVEQVRDWFEIVEPKDSDFAIQRVGGRAGLIRVKDYKTFSPLSHYFIKSHNNQVLPIFQQIDFDTVKFNTAGNPSVSPSELVQLFVTQAQQQGIAVELQ